MNSRIWRVCLPALLVVLAGCSGKKDDGVAGDEADAARAETSSVASKADVSATQLKDLGKLVDLIVAEANELPREEFDPAALAKRLGSDPRAHFEWVRDHTWWVPYRGLLRGSKGVMLDRVGSSLDRAVLLGDLLRRSGHTVRLAHAQLTENRARELLGRVAPVPEQRRSTPVRRPASAAHKLAIEAVIPGYEQALREEVEESSRLTSEAKALVRSQADQLYAAVRAVVGQTPTRRDQGAITAMQDHWWVERQEGGRWVTMDVLLPRGEMSVQIAAPSRTSEWESMDDMPAVPDGDWHTVVIRVVVERYEDGNTTESAALETTLRPAAVFDRPITLHHLPQPWPDRFPDPKTDANARGNAAVSVREWIPYLVIGDEYVVQSGFTEGGDLIVVPFSAKRDIAETGGASIMGGFDVALSGGETASSYMTAEWIEYEVGVPGEAVRQLRRPIFDLLGPTNRSGQVAVFDGSANDQLVTRYEALLSGTDILLQPCEFTGPFVADLASAGVVAKQAALRKLAGERDAAKAREQATSVLGDIDLWGPLPQLALWRAALAARPGETFISRPNVLNYRATLPIVSADQVPLRELIDVAWNSTDVRRNAVQDAFRVRLEQGVADTVAEILSISRDLQMSENAAAVFSIVSESKSDIRVFEPRDSNGIGELDLPPDTAARLTATVASGYIAVAPTQLVQLRDRKGIGWWRIDPASGETVGVMDTGYHGVAEDAELRAQLEASRQQLLRVHLDNAERLMARRASQTARDMRRLNYPVPAELEFDLELFRLTTQLLERMSNYILLLG